MDIVGLDLDDEAFQPQHDSATARGASAAHGELDEATRQFRRFYNHLRWNKPFRVLRVPVLAAKAGFWPMRVSLSCAKQTAKYGRSVRGTTGLSLRKQFVDQWKLCLRDHCWPAGYYKFRLYLPERSAISHRFVHEHEALEVLRSINDGEEMKILDDKLKFAAACAKLGLPHLQTVAFFEDGRLVESESTGDPIQLPPEDLFVKSTNLLCGRGVERWRYVAADHTYERDGTSLTSSQLLKRVADMSKRGAPTPLWKRVRAMIPKLGYTTERGEQQPRPYIMQRRVRNHQEIERSLTARWRPSVSSPRVPQAGRRSSSWRHCGCRLGRSLWTISRRADWQAPSTQGPAN